MAGLNLFTNNAATTLASAVLIGATSLTVASGKGALFPTLAGSDYFYCTLTNNAGSIEIIKVTARSTDTFTIVRGQDGTSAAAWSAGDKVELRLTRIDLLNFPQLDSTNTFATTQTFTAAPVFTDQAGTRTAMAAAKSAANSDITSLSGLTTPLSVAQGGTGAATLTANNVILGNGTSAVAFVAPGTNGNLLTSNGTTWTSAAAPVSGFTNVTVATTPGSFTTPATTTKIKVTVVGAGGAGGTGGSIPSPISASATSGAGGGGGGSAIKIFTVSASTPYPYTVGAASGNTSSFGPVGGTTVSATGGASASPGSGRDGAAGGLGSSGDINMAGSGGGGGLGSATGQNQLSGGTGGSSLLGGGAAGHGPGTGNAGGQYGGGGSGGTGSGGAGAGGVIIIEY
jgi:hypothetical protein